MRNISNASLAKISQQFGAEPILVIGINWGNTTGFLYYADKEIPEAKGKILEIANLENVVTLSGSGTSVNISVKMDDTDGELWNIYNNIDIHRSTVYIYQYFEGIPFSEKFVIYEGTIASPIEIVESERTLSFSLITKIEDNQIGFAVEEGKYYNLEHQAVGTVFPLAFGSTVGFPGITFQNTPTGTTLNAYGIRDRTINYVIGLVDDQISVLQKGLGLTFLYQAFATFSQDYASADNFKQQSIQIQEQIIQLQQQVMQNLNQLAEQEVEIQKAEKYQHLRFDGVKLLNKGLGWPVNKGLIVKIGDQKFAARMNSNGFMHLTPVYLKPLPATIPNLKYQGPAETYYYNPSLSPSNPAAYQTQNPQDYYAIYDQLGQMISQTIPEPITIIQPGSTVTLVGGDTDVDISQLFIASILPTIVTSVWAYRSFDNVKTLAPVPSNYWSQVEIPLGNITLYCVKMKKPLPAYESQNWEEQIYINQTSAVGPNLIDIMIYLISTYAPHLKMDADSFNITKVLVENYPCNFVLTDKVNIIELLNDMAYQARCALWIKEGTIFIKYLPYEEDAVETITENDVEVGSLQVLTTDTENLVTQYTWTYNYSYALGNQARIIVRNNMDKYGAVKDNVDCTIYTDPSLVVKSATFWMIRNSNTWKRVRFNAFISKLKIETFDTILLDFSHPFVSNGPVKALVESTTYDSVNNVITIECWLPIRLGEMTPYNFAWPSQVNPLYLFPDILQEYKQDFVPPKPTYIIPNTIGQSFGTSFGGFDDGGIPTTGSAFDRTYTDQGEQFPSDIGDVYPVRVSDFDAGNIIQSEVAITQYDYSFADLTQQDQQESTSSSYPGKVTSGSGDTYTVDIYLKGLAGEATSVRGVKQLMINEDDTIPAGTWVIVSVIKAQYFMQVPVWLG